MTKDDLIRDIYLNDKIIKYCKTICPTDWEELHSELVIQLYKISFEKLFLAKQGNFLEYMSFTICKRILYGNISGSGIFYKKRHMVELMGEIISDSDSNDDLQKIESIFEIVEGAHWYQKILFKEYYQNGLKLREISNKYSINVKSIHYTIKKFREQIIKKLKDVEKN